MSPVGAVMKGVMLYLLVEQNRRYPMGEKRRNRDEERNFFTVELLLQRTNIANERTKEGTEETSILGINK